MILVIGIILVGIIPTLIVNGILLHLTKENREKLKFAKVTKDVKNLAPLEFTPVEKTQQVVRNPVSLKGLIMPENPDAPTPVNSKKSNTTIENLLFAMKFYARPSAENDTTMSVAGWDATTGYYLPDQGSSASPIMALARNARYLLILKLYQEYFPATHYFDDDAERVERILDKIIEPDRLSVNITEQSFLAIRVPDKIYYDLMWLNKITGKENYRDAALYIADKHSANVIRQSIAIKNSRDRTCKIGLVNDAAMTYIAGVEIGKLDLQEDATLVMKDLIRELWAEPFSLLYTNSTIGPSGNITTTFITNDQMHALVGMIKYAEASGDSDVEATAYTIIESLADGSNPLCDQNQHGFYRRYNGDSMSPHADFKFAEDHITYLDALIKLNILNNGKYDKILNYFSETFEVLLYDSFSNGIYSKYELDWKPKMDDNLPFVSVDDILDYLLLILEDKEFRVEKNLGNV